MEDITNKATIVMCSILCAKTSNIEYNVKEQPKNFHQYDENKLLI